MIIAVGAHSRNVGKTSIICSLLEAIPEVRWTAVKVSANRRGPDQPFRAAEEVEPGADTDSGRYLTAGAARSFWLRANNRQVAEAARFVRALESADTHLIVESNRIVEHLRPDLYGLALDFSVSDFKDSARRLFSQADVYVASRAGRETPVWDDVPAGPLEQRPIHDISPPDYRSPGLIKKVRDLLDLPAGA